MELSEFNGQVAVSARALRKNLSLDTLGIYVMYSSRTDLDFLDDNAVENAFHFQRPWTEIKQELIDAGLFIVPAEMPELTDEETAEKIENLVEEINAGLKL